MTGQRKPVLTGGCQCGAVRYALYAAPTNAGICHCRMCQKAVGGPFTAWANVPTQHFAWTRGTPGTFRSSSAAERGFCPQCGTPLYFAYIRRPGSISVAIGSLDTPEAVTPSQVDGIEGRCTTVESATLAALPARRTGQAGAPEDLSRITNFQHPDHDTPEDWQPVRA